MINVSDTPSAHLIDCSRALKIKGPDHLNDVGTHLRVVLAPLSNKTRHVAVHQMSLLTVSSEVKEILDFAFLISCFTNHHQPGTRPPPSTHTPLRTLKYDLRDERLPVFTPSTVVFNR
ncbi:hypothetical protein Nepgr_031424 [Nepenthes gracilis]|uniref:Uncharacterized protein n=1 Tax=Nepenthes gracilis TaxID=150966 RepID=A0AAD3Y7I0_NEPGR|nr:hypothetical protein Nepgr_031424 [Nepenthes gracilis]